MTRGQMEKAKEICKDELQERKWAFRNNRAKREKKMKDMKYVIAVLNEVAKELELKEQPSIFEG